VIVRAGRLHLGLRAGLAVVAGVVAALGFQPFGWWPVLPFGVAGLSLLALGARRWWQALLLGYCWGLGFMGLGVNWMQAIFVQAMLGLVAFTALYFAGLGLALWAVRRLRAWPVLAALAWVVVEAVAARWPFGGFGWMRLGFAMVDSPLAGLFPLVGTVGVTLATALVANGLLRLLDGPARRPFDRLRDRGAVLVAGAVLAGVLGLSLAGLAWPAGTASTPVSLGWVQGGAPGGGVYGIGPARTTTRNHLAETTALAGRISAGELPAAEAVIWPENGTDMDPANDAQTAAMVQAALRAAGVPILVGTILDGPGTYERQTASLWWDPTGGVLTRYLKRGIVPFGEWVPLRSLLEPLVPELAYVGAQSVAGTEPGVLTVDVPSGPLKLGVMVCYDVAFDSYVFDTVRYGGQVLVLPSSNAMFQGTGQIDQQFAITRARAAELRRETLVVTTSGVSGLIGADGSVRWQVRDPGAASGVESLPRRSGLTPAVWTAPAVELLATLALMALGAASLVRVARRLRPAVNGTPARAQ
jgi:apolipoprotein N-acyltransferase